jgi:hypothetical protein
MQDSRSVLACSHARVSHRRVLNLAARYPYSRYEGIEIMVNTSQNFEVNWSFPQRQENTAPASVVSDELTLSWMHLRKVLSERYPSFEPLNVFSDLMASRLSAWNHHEAAMRATLISQINQLEDIVQALELTRR